MKGLYLLFLSTVLMCGCTSNSHEIYTKYSPRTRCKIIKANIHGDYGNSIEFTITRDGGYDIVCDRAHRDVYVIVNLEDTIQFRAVVDDVPSKLEIRKQYRYTPLNDMSRKHRLTNMVLCVDTLSIDVYKIMQENCVELILRYENRITE